MSGSSPSSILKKTVNRTRQNGLPIETETKDFYTSKLYEKPKVLASVNEVDEYFQGEANKYHYRRAFNLPKEDLGEVAEALKKKCPKDDKFEQLRGEEEKMVQDVCREIQSTKATDVLSEEAIPSLERIELCLGEIKTGMEAVKRGVDDVSKAVKEMKVNQETPLVAIMCGKTGVRPLLNTLGPIS